MAALVYHAKGGLANRLRAFVGYRTLAQRLNLAFLMHWELNGACGDKFHSLFERDGFEDLEFVSAERMHSAALAGAKVLSAGIWFSDIWRRNAADAFDQAAFYRDAASALHNLRPVPSILERIEHFADMHALEECTGVHIRMTDNPRNLGAYNWWAKTELARDVEALTRTFVRGEDASNCRAGSGPAGGSDDAIAGRTAPRYNSSRRFVINWPSGMDPRPFVWSKTADEVFSCLQRLYLRISEPRQ